MNNYFYYWESLIFSSQESFFHSPNSIVHTTVFHRYTQTWRFLILSSFFPGTSFLIFFPCKLQGQERLTLENFPTFSFSFLIPYEQDSIFNGQIGHQNTSLKRKGISVWVSLEAIPQPRVFEYAVYVRSVLRKHSRLVGN